MTYIHVYIVCVHCVQLSEKEQRQAHVNGQSHEETLSKISTIHQVTAMLDTSKYVLFPGPNHLLTTGTDDAALSLSPE